MAITARARMVDRFECQECQARQHDHEVKEALMSKGHKDTGGRMNLSFQPCIISYISGRA